MPGKKKTDAPVTLSETIEDPVHIPESPPQSDATDEPADDLNALLAQMDTESSGLENVGTAFNDGQSKEVNDSHNEGAVSGLSSFETTEPEKSTRASRSKKDTVPANRAEVAHKISQKAEKTSAMQMPIAMLRKRVVANPILTIDSKTTIQSNEDIEAALWHDIQNSRRVRRILTGTLGGLEVIEDRDIIVLHYKCFRVIIPLREMLIDQTRGMSITEYEQFIHKQKRILSNMIGAEIDFIIKGIDSKSRTIVASRREAMLKKRQAFYLNADSTGAFRIYENRIVQARVIAVAEKVVRIEAFGVECSILANDLSWEWIGDAHEHYSVGDQILVRILSVKRNGLEDISITADVKSVSEKKQNDNLIRCQVQGKYSGRVIDVYKGVVFICLSNGANAIAHSCFDRRMPGKKDDISFVVTQIDEERGVAVGIITRIIKQNL